MDRAPVEHRHRRFDQQRDSVIVGGLAVLVLPVVDVATPLAQTLGWPRGPIVAVLFVAALAATARPIERWVVRRTNDSARSPGRYVAAFALLWLGAVVALVGLAWLVWLTAPGLVVIGRDWEWALVRVAAAVAPFAGLPLIERFRPVWLRRRVAEPDTDAHAS